MYVSIILLLCVAYVFLFQSKIELIAESTWKTSITIKNNTGIEEVIFKIPDNAGNGKHKTYIQLCNTSYYVEMVHRNQCEFQTTCLSCNTFN